MRRRSIGAVLVALVALAGAGAAPRAGATAGTALGAAATIGCDQAGSRLTLTTDTVLDPSCTYTAGFDITASDVTLDCAGAAIVGSGGGIGILVSTPADVDLGDVTIRNCHVDGFLNSIHLRRVGFGQLAAGHEYDHHLNDVTIVDSFLTNSRGVSIYVDGYVTATTIRHVVVTGAGSTGVYLDAGSRSNRVTGNLVIGNGFRENGPDGTNTTLNGVGFRYWGPGREGIAVDGSRDNLIARNWIVNNSAGGVFLYTNCGEYVHSDPANWVEHRYGAEGNRVVGNVIVGGENGVWVASRMGENVYPMDCSDVPYVTGPIQAITLDRAADNLVRENFLAELTYGIRVEDDRARVIGNRIQGADAGQWAVIVGTPYRTSVLGRPVADTLVRDNVADIAGNPDPFRWVDGIASLTARGNTANGEPTTFCPAPDLPRAVMVMVYAFALQDPNQPPVTKPDFEIPRLGAQPPCARA
ncbi:MAG: right-handed parallel beta-helix repeat-containing protein [Acidimicrobiia bacterium]